MATYALALYRIFTFLVYDRQAFTTIRYE